MDRRFDRLERTKVDKKDLKRELRRFATKADLRRFPTRADMMDRFQQLEDYLRKNLVHHSRVLDEHAGRISDLEHRV